MRSMQSLRTIPDLRRWRAERRLFEVHADLAAAREEVAVLARLLGQARSAAEGMRQRALVAETPRSQGEWEASRRRVAAAAAALGNALARLAELEAARDGALADLLAPPA